MSNTLKLKYKVGEIEFEAEGPADVVEEQRVNFMNAVLPAAVEAMVRTRPIVAEGSYLDTRAGVPLLESERKGISVQDATCVENDYSRISLSSYIKQYGDVNEQDFTLLAAYFYEIKHGIKVFSIEDIKKFYPEARRPIPKNPSMSLYSLAQKGYIMDADSPAGDGKGGKWYMISEDGISYIKSYTPKENKGEKKKAHTKQRKVTANTSTYSQINADDLNIKNYPAIKTFSGTKEQVVLAMYIVTNEKKESGLQ